MSCLIPIVFFLGLASPNHAQAIRRDDLTAYAAKELEAFSTKYARRVGRSGTVEFVACDRPAARGSYAFDLSVPWLWAQDISGVLYALDEMSAAVDSEELPIDSPRTVRRAPFFGERALNIVLTLPWDYEKDDSDRDPAALNDPARWWFHNDDYWRTLFEQMVAARLNRIDIHGIYDIATASFSNIHAYLCPSDRFPNVGVGAAIQRKNLEQLGRIVAMADERGIRVTLVAHETGFRTPHTPDHGYEESVGALYEYTREVVAEIIRRCSGLDAVGYRIDESRTGTEFFRCYGEAVGESGRDIPLIALPIASRKLEVVDLARSSKDYTVAINFNGEHWGPPYPIAGGRMAGWGSHSFEDYLSYSGEGEAATIWPGNLHESGERWPSQPYRLLWQVRASGTHRAFPIYEPDLVRRSIRAMKLGTAAGFSVESLHAYTPAEPRYFMKDTAHLGYRWMHERDRHFMMLWGRLGYDPEVADAELDAVVYCDIDFKLPEEIRAWRATSRIVSTAFSAYAIGPERRDHAPESDWGGDTDAFVTGEGFDSHSFMSPKEEAAMAATGGRDGRYRSSDVVALLESLRQASLPLHFTHIVDSRSMHRGFNWPPYGVPRWSTLLESIRRLHDLALYYARRIEAAGAEAALAAIEDSDERAVIRNRVADWTQHAANVWNCIAENRAMPQYRPPLDPARAVAIDVGVSEGARKIKAEAERLANRAGRPRRYGGMPSEAPQPASPRTLSWEIESTGLLLVRTDARDIDEAWLLEKPLPSTTYFHKTPMRKFGDQFIARLVRKPAGHALAIEVRRGDRIERHPRTDVATPYLVVPSQSRPTPEYLSSADALRDLDARALNADTCGMLLIAPRAWSFHRRNSLSQQRKILDAVERGLTVAVLEQDYTSGRYPLAWLPSPPAVENCEDHRFDPAGALGLEVIEAERILTQRFRPTPGWDVFGNGGMAVRGYGRGRIIMVQARLIPTMHHPASARNLKRLLELGGRDLPVVIVDGGTESLRHSTSVFPDFMNAHDIPFLTLGEVVANGR